MPDYEEGFGSFAVSDLEAAESFYKDVLKLPVQKNEMGILEFSVNKTQMIIYPKPDHLPAVFTVFNLVVRNLEKSVDELVDKGVKFEQYEGAIKTDEKGISTSENGPKIAWFKDPSGNILSLIEKRS